MLWASYLQDEEGASDLNEAPFTYTAESPGLEKRRVVAVIQAPLGTRL